MLSLIIGILFTLLFTGCIIGFIKNVPLQQRDWIIIAVLSLIIASSHFTLFFKTYL